VTNRRTVILVLAVLFGILGARIVYSFVEPPTVYRLGIENGCIVEYETKGNHDPVVVDSVCP
jgi:prolipoprotein diacylglyceryltransferase